MKLLTVRQVIILHEYMVKKYGGSLGVRDMGMLESAVHRPFATYGGEDLYSDVYLKAGALIQSIVKNHPFVDGNKRAGFTSAYAFLKTNRLDLTASEKEVVRFMVKVANDNLSVDEIASWLKSHCQKLL